MFIPRSIVERNKIIEWCDHNLILTDSNIVSKIYDNTKIINNKEVKYHVYIDDRNYDHIITIYDSSNYERKCDALTYNEFISFMIECELELKLQDVQTS